MTLDASSPPTPAAKRRLPRGLIISAVVLAALTAGLAWAGWASREPAHTLLGIFAIGGMLGLVVVWMCVSTLYAGGKRDEWIGMSLFSYVMVLAAVLFFEGPGLAAIFLPPVAAPVLGLAVFRYGARPWS